MANDQRLPELRLPRRYEVLQREAERQGLDLGGVVRRVDEAARRIEVLLRQLKEGGLGKFELFLGLSGSGKTTFFRTLERFFDGASVQEVPSAVLLADLRKYVGARYVKGQKPTIWVLYDRDNPEVSAPEARALFEQLRNLFRTEQGHVLIVWPITDTSAADVLRTAAWDVGRDSIVSLDTRGTYQFPGVPKAEFYDIADVTTASLNGGRNLEVFGLTRELTIPLVQRSETISEFYGLLEGEANRLLGRYQDILRTRPIPRVWIVVAGDQTRDLQNTVANLTQGTAKRVDIDRVIQFLDNPDLDAAYLRQWKARRGDAGFLLRFLDVRLFELAPNVSLAAIRAFGDASIKTRLTLKNVNEGDALAALSNARLSRLLAGQDTGRPEVMKATEPETTKEYLRVQQEAKNADHLLNKAVGLGLVKVLGAEGVAAKVIPEKTSMPSNLRPDIYVEYSDAPPVCIEITWRTTGQGIKDELPKAQNTLTPGHIQKYMLEKVMSYIDDLQI